MFRRPSLAVLMTLALAAGFFAAIPVAAQDDAGTTQTKATKAAAGTEDANIKSPGVTNTMDKPALAPKNKGGDAAAKGTCYVQLDNWTPWYVNYYVDGSYQGTVPPWGELWGSAISGRTRLYARADFDDGTYLYWGPSYFSCFGSHTWRIDQ